MWIFTKPRLITNIKSRLYPSRKRGNVQNRNLLQISNRACSCGEMVEICKTVAYYEYQMVLLALQKTRKCTESWLITNLKSHWYSCRKALMCTGILCPYYKYKTACRCGKSENSLITKIYRRRRRKFLRIWYVCDG